MIEDILPNLSRTKVFTVISRMGSVFYIELDEPASQPADNL